MDKQQCEIVDNKESNMEFDQEQDDEDDEKRLIDRHKSSVTARSGSGDQYNTIIQDHHADGFATSNQNQRPSIEGHPEPNE